MKEMGSGPIYFVNYHTDKGAFMLEDDALNLLIAWGGEENTL